MSQFVQTPSDPSHTSASTAFTQIDPKVAESLRNVSTNPFDAYSSVNLKGENEGEDRDTSKDEFLYEVVTGLFKQADASYPRMTPTEMLESSFGLIDESPERWSNLKKRIEELQAAAPENVTYRLLYCGRHGQGYHNYGAEFFEPLDWEMNWARLNGATLPNGETITWGPDAELTPLGQDQARANYASWLIQLKNGAPFPERFFVSPLTRTADTMRLSYQDLLPNGSGVGEKPMFVEGVREIFGVHTNDKRRTKTYLHERFPDYVFEEGFAEDDELWEADVREAEGPRRRRIRATLNKFFREEKSTYISITAHACLMRSLVAVVNHPPLSLVTGELLPIVVKCTKQ